MSHRELCLFLGSWSICLHNSRSMDFIAGVLKVCCTPLTTRWQWCSCLTCAVSGFYRSSPTGDEFRQSLAETENTCNKTISGYYIHTFRANFSKKWRLSMFAIQILKTHTATYLEYFLARGRQTSIYTLLWHIITVCVFSFLILLWPPDRKCLFKY